MAVKTPTSGSVQFDAWGSSQIALFNVATVTDGDTLVVPGFGSIEMAFATPSTHTAITVTRSGSTLTFNIGAGTPNLEVLVIGTPAG
jgi:hypothetical protein